MVNSLKIVEIFHIQVWILRCIVNTRKFTPLILNIFPAFSTHKKHGNIESENWN